MSVHSKVRVALVMVMLAGTAGCAVYARPRAGIVYVAMRPPAARVEVIPASPGTGFVWVGGYWRHDGAQFVWMPGRWDRPTAGHRQWVAHHWEHDRNGWYLVEGHWR